MEKQQVEDTIRFYESLVSKFPSAESWAVNILEASKRLTTGIAQTNFYRYLFNPANYSFQTKIKTISAVEEEKYNKMVAEFDANNKLNVQVFKNGRDVKILYTPNKDAEETEPLVGISPSVPSQTQKNVHEGRDESSSQAVQEEKIN